MKVQRNDPCPCGSGKKYKFCCMNGQNKKENIEANVKTIVQTIENGEVLGKIFLDFLSVIKRDNWIGACHAISSSLYVVLREIGFVSKLCIGEVKSFETPCFFDHSWIEVENKVIDLAIGYPLQKITVSAPILLDLNVETMQTMKVEYGVYKEGMGPIAEKVYNQNFVEYMNDKPECENGLWSIVQEICEKNNIQFELNKYREKYKGIKREYVKRN